MKILNWIKKVLGIKTLPFQSWDRSAEDDEYDEIKDAHFEEIFGKITFGSFPSKDWSKFLPLKEIQAFGDCIPFSRNNCAETKAKKEGVADDEGNEFNFSDLDLAVGSGTTKTGNSLKAVAEYARKVGVSLEKDCPYTRNWNERVERFNAAKDKKKYKLGNWAWTNCNNNSFKAALSKSPLQIAVGVGYNWNDEGIIRDPNSYQAYHAITLYYIDENDTRYIYDHYDKELKQLDKNYNVFYSMVFLDFPETWRGDGVDDVRFYKRMIGKLIILPESSGEVYRIEQDSIRKVKFVITDKLLWDLLQEAMREKKVFLGVSNKDFERLKKVAFESGKGLLDIEEEVDIKSILEDI